MKILIGYDGSEYSDTSILDLHRAGLPATGQLSLLSVVEVPPQPAAAHPGASIGGRRLEDAQTRAKHSATQIHSDFPGWLVETESCLDAAGPAIVRKAHAWKPDLVMVGSHGRTGVSRFVLGSVSQHMLHHVPCSVRICRPLSHSSQRAIRILIGVDGSTNAAAAVKEVASRNWPAGTEVRVLSILDTNIALAAAGTLEGTIPVKFEEESKHRLSQAAHDATQTLANHGLHATHHVFTGVPGDVLIEEADKWAADCIFVGARGLNGMERLLLGSVSTAASSHAHCSVEVVRINAG